jgi:hypothetical protein
MQEERFRMNDKRNTVVTLEDLYFIPCKELSLIIRGEGVGFIQRLFIYTEHEPLGHLIFGVAR